MTSQFIGRLGILAMAMAAVPGFADTSATIRFDGSQLNPTATLTDVESHTLYESHEVPDTCYRTIDDGTTTECSTVYRDDCDTVYHDECSTTYHDECSTSSGSCHRVQGSDGVWRDECSSGSTTCERVPSTECNRVPEQQCTRVPEEQCEQVPHSHEESYACTRTISTPIGEETDYRVTANVALSFSAVPTGIQPSENLALTLENEKVELSPAGLSSKLLLFAKATQSVATTKPDQGASSPGEKVVSARFDIQLVDVNAVLSGVQGGLSDVAIQGNALTFSLGKVALPNYLGLRLTLDRDKLFGSQKLYNDALPRSSYSLKDEGGRTVVTVALDQLSLPEQIKKGSKYVLSLSATIDKDAAGGDATLLNPEALGNAEAHATNVKVKAQ